MLVLTAKPAAYTKCVTNAHKCLVDCVRVQVWHLRHHPKVQGLKFKVIHFAVLAHSELRVIAFVACRVAQY
jgi:hypothetical protein